MKLLLENWRQFLDEDIKPYTNTATAYHSFGVGESFGHRFELKDLEKVVRSISNEGFKPGEGQMYGKGIYTVLEPRFLRKKYGNFCLIFDVVNLDKFLILNYKKAKKIKDNQLTGHTLREQMERLGVSITDEINTICRQVDSNNRGAFSYTSNYALKLSKIPEVKQKIRGLVFDGLQDGQVLVGYYPEDFSVTGYGEVHVSESTTYKDFILSKDFYDEMYKLYKPKDPRINPKSFISLLNKIFVIDLNPRTGASAGKISTIMRQPLERWREADPEFDGLLLQSLARDAISEEAYDDLAKKIYGPSLYEKYKAFTEADFFSDEADDLRDELEEDPRFEERDDQLNELIKDTVYQEVDRFFKSGYYYGMKRKFNLSDKSYIRNIKRL